MLSPAYLIDCAEEYAYLYSQLESDICADIARRIAKSGRITQTASWQIRKLKESRAAYEAITRELQRTDKSASKILRATMLDAAQQSLKYDDAIYRAIGLMPTSVAASKAMQNLILAGVKKTNGVMHNLTKTTANTASKAFENALDRAYMQVQSGAFSFDQALRMVVQDLGRQGYEKIAYPSGSVTRLDSAARSALMTGLNQTTAELQLARMEEMGTDLVEVTSHMGARPTHAVWQGGIYSRSGKHPRYPDFVASTQYGSGEGLCGWNCYHSFFPYTEGVSAPTFSRTQVNAQGKTNDQVYEESQKQRYYERQVRNARLECVTLNAAIEGASSEELENMLRSDFSAASVKLKRREARLEEYCEATNRRMYSDRVQVYGFNQSVSAKAVWANRKAQKKSA